MGGLFAQSAKIVGCGNNALSKDIVPKSVEQNARFKGVRLAGYVLCELKPSRVFVTIGPVVECFQKLPRHRITRLFVVTANE